MGVLLVLDELDEDVLDAAPGFPEPDLAESDLADPDLAGSDLAGSDFAESDCAESDLAESDFDSVLPSPPAPAGSDRLSLR